MYTVCANRYNRTKYDCHCGNETDLSIKEAKPRSVFDLFYNDKMVTAFEGGSAPCDFREDW